MKITKTLEIWDMPYFCVQRRHQHLMCCWSPALHHAATACSSAATEKSNSAYTCYWSQVWLAELHHRHCDRLMRREEKSVWKARSECYKMKKMWLNFALLFKCMWKEFCFSEHLGELLTVYFTHNMGICWTREIKSLPWGYQAWVTQTPWEWLPRASAWRPEDLQHDFKCTISCSLCTWLKNIPALNRQKSYKCNPHSATTKTIFCLFSVGRDPPESYRESLRQRERLQHWRTRVLQRTASQVPKAWVLETWVREEAKDPVCLVNSPPGKCWREKAVWVQPFPPGQDTLPKSPPRSCTPPAGTQSKSPRPNRQLGKFRLPQTPNMLSQGILEVKHSLTAQTCLSSLPRQKYDNSLH